MANFTVSVSAGEIASELSDDMEAFAEVLSITPRLITDPDDLQQIDDFIKAMSEKEQASVKKLVEILSLALGMAKA